MAFESPGWVSILNTTIPKFIRQETVNILRSRILLAMMESKGRITMNNSGLKFDWKVEYKRAPLLDFADGDVISYGRIDRHKTAQLPNDRGYIVPEMMSVIDTLQNSGDEAIIKLWSTKAATMMADIREFFCDQLYLDGNASGNTKKIHGIESFLGAGTTKAAPRYMSPTSNYANLNCVPGTYGGVWSNGTWPNGSGQPQYDFWSPILVDYTSPVSGAWSAATKTWQNTCNEALRAVITKTRKSKAKEGMIDLILLEDTLYEQYKNAQDSRQQIYVQRGDAVKGSMTALGFETMNFDGVDIGSEFGMPVNTGYAFNTMQMELKSMQAELFDSFGPAFDEVTRTYRWLMSFIGNLVCNPKFFGKLYAYGQA